MHFAYVLLGEQGVQVSHSTNCSDGIASHQ